MPNFTQKITTYRSGDNLSASEVNKIIDGIFSRIKAGKGSLVRRIGQNVMIDVNPIGLGVKGGGSTSSLIPTVESLPAAPENGVLMVFWTSDGDGDGDDQIYAIDYNSTNWYPVMKVTSKDTTAAT